MPSISKGATPKKRFLSLADAGQKELNQKEIDYLNSETKFKNDLGIEVNQGVPGGTGNGLGTPRLFLMQTGKDMSDNAVSFADTELPNCWGAEFWKQVQLGNVFVYPARSAKPCQLQLERKDGKLSLSVSEPLEVKDLPAREVKKPNRWQRFWHGLYSGFYKEQVESYDKLEQSKEQVAKTVQRFNSERAESNLSDEKDSVIIQQEEMEKQKRDKKYTNDIKPIQEERNAIEKQEKLGRELFSMKPARYSLSKFGGAAEKENLDQVKLNTVLRDYRGGDYRLNDNTVRLDDKDFTAMAFFTAKDPMKAVETLNQQNMGGKAGLDTLKDVVQPARKNLRDALRDYQDNNMAKKLVETMAEGLINAVDMLKGQRLNGRFTPAQKAAMKMAGDMYDLLENKVKTDDKMKGWVKNAVKAKGRNFQEDLAVIQGYAKFAKLNDTALQAKSNLISAEHLNNQLEDHTRKQYVQQIVKAELAEQIMANELQTGKTTSTCNLVENEKELDKIVNNIVLSDRLNDPQKTGSELVQNIARHDFAPVMTGVAFHLSGDNKQKNAEIGEQVREVAQGNPEQQIAI